MTTKIMPATELRARIGQILDELIKTGEPVFVTRHGRAQAVLISVTAFDALIQHAEQADQAIGDPLDRYQALLGQIDFTERGDAAARRQHAQEVYEELAEARRRANIEMMGHE